MFQTNPLRVIVVGTGYVGLTTGLALAYLGHQVIGVDKDPQKLERLRAGISPIHEAGVPGLLSTLGGRVMFTERLRETVGEADVILIAVGTRSKENGEADTRYVEAAAREVSEGL